VRYRQLLLRSCVLLCLLSGFYAADLTWLIETISLVYMMMMMMMYNFVLYKLDLIRSMCITFMRIA